jgi:hypothetical protein
MNAEQPEVKVPATATPNVKFVTGQLLPAAVNDAKTLVEPLTVREHGFANPLQALPQLVKPLPPVPVAVNCTAVPGGTL